MAMNVISGGKDKDVSSNECEKNVEALLLGFLRALVDEQSKTSAEAEKPV